MRVCTVCARIVGVRVIAVACPYVAEAAELPSSGAEGTAGKEKNPVALGT